MNLIINFAFTVALAQCAFCCMCVAPEKDDAVCGSDGITYASSCYLFCAGFVRNEIETCLTMVSNGKCGESECICNETCNFVCGSNGE